ncbi:neocarzinostatin apoprotein domain-containing protein [Nocardioides lianchengensis]|uniref:Neocarzinostatin family protein n=1 Tax=Nocardioides lianchengensis TaxID=1045774 RepID=A0A1G6V9I3_9ACTN|nr:neocarzinostatin apoprotein domain-containing protein [Nocardioides lianchengensis]NYG11196.1 hypothetical protein [Nocardioides lianchengensis]SDD50228.1 Neocarzinostatin family protein [Nocardioides lianchengensis]
MPHLTLVRRISLLLAAVASLVLVTTSSAFAATSVSQTTGLTDGQVITISGSGLTPSSPHKVGVCSTQTYLGIPACTAGTEVTTDATGAFSISYTATKTNTNVHKTALPWPLNVPQPTSFTCKGASGVDCQLLITEHPTGGTKATVGTYDITFL